MGDVGCFSFYPGKNLGAYGEGGMVLTNDKNLADKLKMYRDHGSEKKYYHKYIGINGRMEGFQGAVLGVKLKHLDDWTENRRKVAEKYNEMLNGLEIILPYEDGNCKHVYHLYVIRSRERDRLGEYLSEKGVASGIHYPIPNHLQDSYQFLGYKTGDFPVTEKLASEMLSLPMYPEMTEEQIEYVVNNIRGFLN